MNLFRLFEKSRKSKVDFMLMISISSLPFLFYIYNFIPETKVLKTALFEIDAGFYGDSKKLIWYLSVKILTLLLLSLWYLSCSQKWRFIILFPVFAEISKIIFLIKSIKQVLNNEFFLFETFLFSIPYIFFLLFISHKMTYNKESSNTMKFNNEINNEIASLSEFNSKDYIIIKKELIQIMKNKNITTNREYLIKLIALRDRMTN